MKIYNIYPDPKHTKRIEKHWRRHAFWQAVRGWLYVWRWHVVKPWAKSKSFDWTRDELWPTTIPCSCGLTMRFDDLEQIYICEDCHMTQRCP